MIPGNQLLMLTSKGREELVTRVYRLDPMGRNILFLIDKGNNTADAIVQRSVFPQAALLDRLTKLVADRFLDLDAFVTAVTAGTSAARPAAVAAAPGRPDTLRLQTGISLSQARFALSDFCLDHFGTRSQNLVDAIGRCNDLATLQHALDRIHADVGQHVSAQLPTLIACVDEINQTAG